MPSFFTSNKWLLSSSILIALMIIGVQCSQVAVSTSQAKLCPVTDSALPTDIAPYVTETTISKWFKSDTIRPNGVVKPANSVTFPANTDTDFHQWSEQMFLWLTSPHGKGYVFNSALFHAVLSDGSLQRIHSGLLLHAKLRHAKKGSSTSEGQAGHDASGVLMSQNGSLVYYITMVNDVFVTYKKAVEDNAKGVDKKHFPTSATDLAALVAYAKAQKIQLPDSIALAMELKTSWVEASTVCNPENFITMDAQVAVYDQSKPDYWTAIPNQAKTVKLALVGMHVVGSVRNHPEMVWATFEHRGNAPNAAYSYLNIKKDTIKVLADSSKGNWTFGSPKALYGSNNAMFMKMDTAKMPNIMAASAGLKISASNAQRTKPWGGDPSTDAYAGKTFKSNESNANVISINNSVLNALKAGDIRKNYLFIGSLWTHGGLAPVTNNDKNNYNLLGSTLLANATMETYKMS
ncbi:MAG: hypothetical protein RIS64_3999, partial [Bacteroidota bacterium]